MFPPHSYHLFSRTDFLPEYQDWEKVDPAILFTAPTQKMEANAKTHICKHLKKEAKGTDYLVLWLDCDREGENICFEVMDNTVQYMNHGPGQRIFRAKFSGNSQQMRFEYLYGFIS